MGIFCFFPLYKCLFLLQPVVRIYDIPDHTFESDEEEDDDDDDDDESDDDDDDDDEGMYVQV